MKAENSFIACCIAQSRIYNEYMSYNFDSQLHPEIAFEQPMMIRNKPLKGKPWK